MNEVGDGAGAWIGRGFWIAVGMFMFTAIVVPILALCFPILAALAIEASRWLQG